MNYENKIRKWEDMQVGDTASFTKTMTETEIGRASCRERV